LAGVPDEKTEGLDRESPVSLCYFHLADDTASMPTSRGLLTGPTRFFEEQGQRALTGIPSPQAHAVWEALTAHTEPQKDLLESITPIFAMPIGRPGWDKPRNRADLLLIGAIQADRRRILMEPGCREGIDLQGVEGDRPTHAVALRGKQRIEHLSQPVIMERGAREAGLEQGEYPTLLQACPYLIESMMAIKNREEQRLHTTPTRENMGRVWRAERIDKCRHVELA
jgi:hypothetical protein